MNYILASILLQAASGGAGGGMSGMIMILAIIVIFYFFMIRPQNKKQKEIKKAREAMKKGDKFKDIVDFLCSFLACVIEMMDIKTFGDDVHDFFTRVEAGHRILENHLHVGMQETFIFTAHLTGDIASAELNRSFRRMIKADDGAAGCGFTGTGFAYKSVGFSFVNIEVDAINGFDCEFTGNFKVLFQVRDFE